jgi:Transposase
MVLRDNIPLEKPTAVQLKTILNHVERHKSFVYQEARWADPAIKTQIEIPIEMNKAIDDVRASEARQMKADGYEEILKHSRCCLLKRPENLTEKQTVKLSHNLASLPEPEFTHKFW